MKTRAGFTLLEITIVVGIIAILGATIPLTANFRGQVEKSYDTKRKADLARLTKVLEEYQNDSSSYPTGANLCFDEVTENIDGTCQCHICGMEANKSSFSPYMEKLPCDPQYAAKNYLYHYDCSTSQPRWYRACAVLSALPFTGNYNYGVASPNADPDVCLSLPFSSAVPFATATPLPTLIPPTSIPTATQTPAPTLTPTSIPSGVPTATSIPTATPVIPTSTSAPIPTATRTPTPSPTRTPTPTPTPICATSCSELFTCLHGRCEFDDRICHPDAPYYCY